MALIKHRIYNTHLFNPFPTASVSNNYEILGAQHNSPTATHLGTLLRTRAEFNMVCSVGAPVSGPPPEGWWTQCDVMLLAFWVPSGSTALIGAGGTSETYLGSAMCEKRLVASPSDPSSYYVNYFTQGPMVTETARKPTGVVGGPSVNWYIQLTDNQFAFDGSWGAFTPNAWLRTFSLWGDTV